MWIYRFTLVALAPWYILSHKIRSGQTTGVFSVATREELQVYLRQNPKSQPILYFG